MGAAVVHFEIYSKDLKRASEFYSSLFGWNFQPMEGMNYVMVNTGLKLGIGGGFSSPAPDKPTFVTVYIQVEDPQSSLDKAVQMGATVIVPVTEIPNMVTFAMFTDLDGNVVGLVKGPQSDPVEKPKPKPKPKSKAKKRTVKVKKVKSLKGKGKKKKSKK
ncbi:MAG: VOC family protein [bacterium]